jgi:hydroxymethylbilane synthase
MMPGMSELSKKLRLGTRGSLLARTQSGLIAALLQPHLPVGCSIELVTITTSGDKQQEGRLQEMGGVGGGGGKGLFVKEIDEALLEGRVDFAVHSAKDLPMERPAGLTIACTPKREDPRDMWVGRDGITIDALPTGAKVGTASLRRQSQLLSWRPDVSVVTLRGNIDTRLKKVATGVDGISGTFLAASGLIRAGLVPAHAAFLPVDKYVPAAGQGTLAIEARAQDGAIQSLLAKIHDSTTAACLAFERSIVKALAGSCLAPIGVCAQPREQEPGWIVRALVASPDGKAAARCALMAQSADVAALHGLRDTMLKTLAARGAMEILASLPAV